MESVRRGRGGLAAAFALLVASAPALAGGGRHPHFDDRGTLTWHRTLADARTAARTEGKAIFVEFGRLRCPQCRVVVAKVLPQVRDRASRVALGLAAECDRPEPEVDAIFRRWLPRADILPFCAFLTPDGEWITGWSGGRTVPQFEAELAKAEAALARWHEARRPRREPAPTPSAPPSSAPERAPASPRERRVEAPPAPPAAAPTPPVRAEPTPEAPRPEPPSPAPPREAPLRTYEEGPPLGPIADPLAFGTPDGEGAIVAAPLPGARPVPPLTAREPSPRPTAGARHPTGTRPGPSGRGASDATAAREDHEWASERLDAAIESAAAGRYEEALLAVHDVQGARRGHADAEDARRGEDAIRRKIELGYLNTTGPVYATVLHTARQDMRGTRWVRLFP